MAEGAKGLSNEEAASVCTEPDASTKVTAIPAETWAITGPFEVKIF